MCTKICIALMATAIFMSSCEWFTSSPKPNAANQLEGQWKVDSITAGQDTSTMFPLILAMAAYDSNQQLSMHFDFKKDTVFTTYAGGDRDSTLYTNDVATQTILIKGDSLVEVMSYRFAKDSLMSIAFKDSTLLHLSRR